MQGLTVAASGNDSRELAVTAAACLAMRASGRTPSAFAPVALGDARSDLELVAAAAGADSESVAPHRFASAAAPYVAAKLEGMTLDPALLLDRLRAAAAGDVLVTALAGGLLSPLTPRYSVRDLARDLGAPVVIATYARPGLLNEALTTIAAARGGALHVAGVVLTGWDDDPARVVLEERGALADLAGVPVVTLPDAARDAGALEGAAAGWPIDDWLEPTPDAHAAAEIEQHQEVVLDPYTAWESGEPLGDPRVTPRPRLMAALEEIVAAEGPLTATRAYALYNRGSGGRKLTSAARAPLSSALNWLAREGKVTLVREADVPWQGDDVARMPDHPEVRVRELGPRELIDVPLDEIAELMRRLRAAHGVADETGLKRAVLSAYGLVRLTARADEYLGLALQLAGEPASAP